MSECWNYNKFAIMQTSKHSDAWIASHFGIYFDETFNIYFGNNGKIWYLNDFAGILEFDEINYWEALPSEIVDIIEKQIDEGLYVIVYLMTDVNSHKVHEYLFYGYDYQCLYSLSLIKGRFGPVKLSKSWVFQTYKNYYDYHLYNPNNIAWFSANFFPITIVRVTDRLNESVCFQEAVRRFEEELNGKQLKTINDQKLYTGIECIKAMHTTTKNILKDRQYIDGQLFDDISKRYRLGLCKIYEHMMLVSNSMIWMLKLMQEGLNHKFIVGYNNCIETVQQLAMISVKFSITRDWNLLEISEGKFEDIYCKTKENLQLFLKAIVLAKNEQNQKRFTRLIDQYPNLLTEREYFI